MNTRSTRSARTFSSPLSLPVYLGELPAGDYDVLAEEEFFRGLSFEAYRRTTTYLTVHGKGRRTGRNELRLTTESGLKQAQLQDITEMKNNADSERALFPQEDGI